MLQCFVCSPIPKVSEKRGNRSEFHSERNYYLKNWYFRGKNKKNETKVAESQKVFQLYRFLKKCVKSLSSKFFTLVEKLRIEITNLPRFLRNDKLKKTPWDQSNFNLLPSQHCPPKYVKTTIWQHFYLNCSLVNFWRANVVKWGRRRYSGNLRKWHKKLVKSTQLLYDRVIY